MQTLIFRTSAHIVTSFMLVFAVYLLLRGHNAPGGGFIAGLIAVIAMALLMLAEGPDYVRQRLVYSPVIYAISGIVLSLFAGFIPLLFGKAFLTGLWAQNLPIGTPLLFDFGVFFAVLGSVLTILLNVEEELS
ncbi:Na(+)/H(+) antiporter subunit B [BD1-7 clade bacterium]|uniref:Na(+)/H(+) antiporter subunit B n=1 Tax=BD1-7 clade bacterium TaxID=2029982 RepID=A0A5S9PIK8_9GAMM|nr:Na(+)/H(+) antiporter subunit B [BD1-7 clade bacterium]CAA0103858.1 Na(+)/H(+) antiporter subunit B [BD1-7 clade bacterium]CAA0103894.1 Na(+)/H(+) antiporter subunit B [BD1-7 clade bacterium]